MKLKSLIILTIALLFFNFETKSVNNPEHDKRVTTIINGLVLSKGEAVPFASIQVLSSTIGTASDINGQYRLELPPGEYQIKIQAVGLKPVTAKVVASANSQQNYQFELEEDILNLEQVVVTADRNARKRTESSVVVNTLNSNLFNSLQTSSLSEGLGFCPGLRMENNCGNCGSNQVRMNGLDGPYSQILINGRPIFSGLASVYGLELIPTSMIDRVEVVRGGGSALYGSNAIAGTVNVITKEPVNNNYEVQMQTALIGAGTNPKPDNSLQFNTTLTSENSKQGIAIYGFHRNRSPYDANGDGFSELSKIKNSTLGIHWGIKPGYRSKFSADFFHIDETRRGGDAFNKPLHESNIAEATEHRISSGNLNYHLFTASNQELSLFAAAQSVNRDSYYGADKALDAYGNSSDLSYSAGSQYKITFSDNTLIMGVEINGGRLEDRKLGYREYSADNNELIETIYPNRLVADQRTTIGGVFSQWERRIGHFSLSAGLRMDHYSISDELSAAPDISNMVISPRVNILWGLNKPIQARLSYSKGYRAPQIFDEDLHIETSTARQVFHVNDPDLKQETSHSYMASLNYQLVRPRGSLEFMAEFFYTNLRNPFANEIGTADENGIVTYTRVNEEEGAIVKGINLETTWIPSSRWRINGSFTFQSSQYGAPQDFDERKFLRTPNHYGYLMVEYKPIKKLTINTNATYTGKMLVPYFGPLAPVSDEGEIIGLLKESDTFFDWSLKAGYDLSSSVGNFQIFAGVKNILNSYQKDHDIGAERDPGYIYGPLSPRTLFFGIRIRNFL